ncbi:MAG: leucyl aminopeptidase [Candidatus Aceula meridiana]|nr:leucyl aminopeptidase [Candidatus Aceula meridiana]
MLTFNANSRLNKDAVIVFLTEESAKSKKWNFKNLSLSKDILQVISAKQFLANEGEQFPLVRGKQVCLLVGLGKRSDVTKTSLRTITSQAVLSPFLKKLKSIDIVAHEQNEATIIGIIEGILIGGYRWEKYIAKKSAVLSKSICILSVSKKIYIDTIASCAGVNLTRDLVNDNADVVNSNTIEKTIRHIVSGKKNISLKILTEKELKKKGLNLLLAVNKGSKYPPKLIIVNYRGSSKKGDYTAIVGKGVTFDTGGLNLKPTGYIETMRLDMGGAGAVIGTLKNTISLKIKKNILFVCGVVENAIGPNAYKPGDVVKSYDGKTVEVANTDAEGRLVLADALSYLVKNYKPARIIDLATLTGACVVALGYDYSGLVSSDDNFAKKVLAAANDTDDRAWQLPSYNGLKDHLKSQYADIKNTGLPKGAAGTMSAGEFLRQFVGKTKWAHLDIAGTAFVAGPSRMYFGYGATGAGVRLLTDLLKNKL